MVSRKDELNAYTFARKRTVAAFLQPSPSGTEEGAPRPLRTVMPGLVVGALILAGFGAWGMFKPAVPANWSDPGKKVIIGSDSTTRYVVLETDGERQLHPVLNLSSARLLLNGGTFEIVSVDEKILDSGEIPQGPTLGIPYAPDRLPSSDEAREAKRWAVCQQPGAGDGGVQQAVFVLADRDAARVDGRHRLRGGEVLYVEADRDGARYLIDPRGTKYLIGGPQWDELPEATGQLLHRTLVGEGQQPQRVTGNWLDTFQDGSPVVFPELPGTVGEPAGVAGLTPEADRVGTVLLAPTGAGPQHYLVLPGKVVPVSDFTARLLLNSPQALPLEQHGHPLDVALQAFTPAPAEESIDHDHDWPEAAAEHVNGPAAEGASRTTLCSVLRDVDAEDGTVTLSTWAGTAFPATIVNETTSAYVTPGTGLLYRQVQGEQAEAGGIFLVTDTGLRYAVQANTDSDSDSGEPEEPGDSDDSAQDTGRAQQVNQAQIRLGYGDVEPVPVPAQWSQFLPTGPRLDTAGARQPQGS
ncbi:type VII secretion protein EccB [Streptomyces sodiiphilus]|uniref:Type VII secretion protein EccB n=1 Tax=Streptomyces sodiiphilus TaxID=226217 RepID=A0ABN2PV55_9ACTN